MNIYKIFSFALVITLIGIPLKAVHTIHSAAACGKLDAVKEMVEQCPGVVNSLDKYYCTPLHEAVFYGHFEVVKYLIEKKALVNLKNNDGETPLHYAAYKGYFEIVDYLIRHGADIDALRLGGITPLFFAIEAGTLKKSDELKSFLHTALILVNAGANINAIETGLRYSNLHNAVNKNPLWVQYLVEFGADIYAKNSMNRTPLEWAAEQQFSHTSRYLQDVQDYYEKGITVSEQDIKSRKVIPNYCILAAINGNFFDVNTFFDPSMVDSIPFYVESIQLPQYKIINYNDNWISYFKNIFNLKEKNNDWGIRQLIWLYLTHKPDNKEAIYTEDSFKETYVASPIKGKAKNKLWLQVLMQYNLYKKEPKLNDMKFYFKNSSELQRL